MAVVELRHVSVELDGEQALRDVSLVAGDGELLAIVGSSGSGKTTLLRAVAGLDRPTAGSVHIADADVTRASPASRDIGMVFQQPALLPNRNVRRNVSFPLEIRHQEVAEIRRRVNAEVRALRIEELLLKRPAQLSRGEVQLVQIARALVRVPSALLLDEPFATLDPELKHRMRAEIGLLQRGYRVTTLMTTNDPDDVASLPDRLAVLDAGRLVQVGTRAEVHRSPVTLSAAMATGLISTIPVTVRAEDDGLWLVRDDPSEGLALRLRAEPALADRAGEQVVLGVRPEDVRIGGGGGLRGRVVRVVPGASSTIWCRIAGHTVWIQRAESPVEVDDVIPVEFRRSTLFDATSGYAITR